MQPTFSRTLSCLFLLYSLTLSAFGSTNAQMIKASQVDGVITNIACVDGTVQISNATGRDATLTISSYVMSRIGGAGEAGNLQLSTNGTNTITYSIAFSNIPSLVIQNDTGTTANVYFHVRARTLTNATFVAYVTNALWTNRTWVAWSTVGALGAGSIGPQGIQGIQGATGVVSYGFSTNDAYRGDWGLYVSNLALTAHGEATNALGQIAIEAVTRSNDLRQVQARTSLWNTASTDGITATSAVPRIASLESGTSRWDKAATDAVTATSTIPRLVVLEGLTGTVAQAAANAAAATNWLGTNTLQAQITANTTGKVDRVDTNAWTVAPHTGFLTSETQRVTIAEGLANSVATNGTSYQITVRTNYEAAGSAAAVSNALAAGAAGGAAWTAASNGVLWLTNAAAFATAAQGIAATNAQQRVGVTETGKVDRANTNGWTVSTHAGLATGTPVYAESDPLSVHTTNATYTATVALASSAYSAATGAQATADAAYPGSNPSNFISGINLAGRNYLASERTIWVATNGSDSADGRTPEKAKRTLGAGIGAAGGANWTVTVRDGVYVLTNTVFVTNSVTLKSENGAERCVVDGNGTNRCFVISGATVDGFSITGGRVFDDDGAGVYINEGTLLNCRVYGNIADGSGANGNGGGVHVTLWYALIENCTIYSNTAHNNGGGINFLVGGDYQTVRNCLIHENTADWGGGVFAMTYGVSLNTCSIEGSTITRNTATGTGGGGIYLYNAPGYGIPMTVNIQNTISYNNFGGSSSNFVKVGSINTPVLFSCISPLLAGNGNTAADPCFISSNDFHLAEFSPCVNGGTNLTLVAGASDLDGNPRVAGGRTDIGAYESLAYPLVLSGSSPAFNCVTGGAFNVGGYGFLQVVSGTQLVFVAGAVTNVLDVDILHP